MRLRLRRPSKPTVFAILMVAAALAALLLPAGWSSCASGMAQPLGWFQWITSSGTRGSVDRAKSLAAPRPTRAEVRRLRRQNEELAQKLRHQQATIAQLERRVANLAGLRTQIGDVHAKIILASVVGGDTSPQRETVTISRGREHGVKLGDWVAAGVGSDERDPTGTGRDLLLRQWLVGRVSEAQPYLSRVQLATDPHFGPQRVWTARPTTDGTWQLANSECGLESLGNGRMRIDRASEDYLATGYTIVLVPLAHPRPMALAIGRIVASEMLGTGLHYDLEVEPWGNPRMLSHVYVISLAQ